jgi:hypothetical protein
MKKIMIPLAFPISLTLPDKLEGQSMLQQYFNGNKDSLLTKAVTLINMPNPTFKPAKQAIIDPATLADIGFEQGYKSENYYFITRDNKKIFSCKFPKSSFAADKFKKTILDNSNGEVYIIQGTSHNGIRHNSEAYKIIQNWFINL